MIKAKATTAVSSNQIIFARYYLLNFFGQDMRSIVCWELHCGTVTVYLDFQKQIRPDVELL